MTMSKLRAKHRTASEDGSTRMRSFLDAVAALKGTFGGGARLLVRRTKFIARNPFGAHRCPR